MKRLLVAVVVVMLVAAGAGLWIYQTVGAKGGSAIEDWIRVVLVGALEARLTPRVSLAELDYQAPYSVALTELALVAEGERILSVRNAFLELAEVPKRGEPIRIAQVAFEGLELQFLEREDGGFLGWSDLVRSGPAATQPAGAEEPFKLSDILRMRKLTLDDGAITFDPAGEEPPMVLTRINLDMNTPPDEDDPGWYRVDAQLARGELLRMAYAGRVNLDTTAVDIEQLELNVQLAEPQYETLPPQLQQVLREHEVRGALALSASGYVAAGKLAEARLQVDMRLTDGRVVLGEMEAEVSRLELAATVSDGSANARLLATAFGGEVESHTEARLTQLLPVSVNWNLRGIQLSELTRDTSERSAVAGTLTSDGRFTARLNELPASIGGNGQAELTDARLVRLPLIADLSEVMDVHKMIPGDHLKDRGRVDFVFHPEHVELTEFELVTALLAARGSGKINYDATQDLLVRAGPVEKLKSLMGPLGDVLGKVTDRFMAYEVTGPLDDPQIRVKPINLDGGG